MDKSKYLRLTAALIVFIMTIGISNQMIAQQNIYINTNTTWSTNQTLTGNLFIKNGATLTVSSGVTVTMPLNGYILVEEDCKLIANNATFTSNCTSWFGIYAKGYGNNYDQLYFKNTNGEKQPEIILTNCTVEKMQYGINNAWGLGNPNITSGGVLKLKGCTFNKNKLSVRFYHYTHERKFVNPDPNKKYFARELSYIYDCNFNEQNYWPNPIGVFIREIVDLRIFGCNFTSTNGTMIGIESHLATFNVNDYYVNQPFNPTLVSSAEFHNCTIGVFAVNSNASQGKVVIRDAAFTNNKYAISAQNADNIEIYSNSISIQQDATPIKKVGIYLEHCATFAVENNTVTATGYNGNFPTKTWGIVANNCGGNNNKFYRNTVSNCAYNIVGEQSNRLGSESQSGLQFICNNLSQTNAVGTDNTYYMAALVDVSHRNDPDYGINEWQAGGELDFNSTQFAPSSAAHNTIPNRNLPAGSKFDFYNEHVRLPMDIHYKDPVTNTLPLQQLDDDPSTIINDYYGDYIWVTDAFQTYSTTCPNTVPSLFPTPTELNDKKQEYQAVKAPYGPLKGTFDSYVNNGDHQFMLDQVNNMNSSNYVTVYYYLMNNHPSTDVIAIAVGNDVLPSYMCTDVLVTNSYGIKSQLVRDALAGRQNQLSSTQMAAINSAAQNQSQYESYLLELASLRTQINSLGSEIYNYYFNSDTDIVEIDEVISTLEDNDNFYSYVSLMMYYFESHDNSSAEENYNNAMNAEEVSYLETSTLDRLYTILWKVYDVLGGDYSQLSQADINILESIAESDAKAGGIAKSILITEFSYNYDPLLMEATQSSPRLAKTDTKCKQTIYQVKIVPNPAKDYIGIIISEDFNYPLHLQIYDISGKLVMEKQIEKLNTIPVDRLTTGQYQLKLRDANNKEFVQKLIIK